jgi:hypothetical protein
MSILASIIQFSQSNAGWDVIKSLASYYDLRDYLSFQLTDEFQPDKVRTIRAQTLANRKLSGDEVFWREIITGRLIEGMKVKLLNFQISPSFPRKPGVYWTYEAAAARRRAKQHHVEAVENNTIVFDVWGKTLMTELGGIGTVTFRKNRDDILITATASGDTDRGIPLIVSRQIWDQINDAFRNGSKLKADLRGTIVAMPLEYDSYFFRGIGVPKVAVKVGSLLNIDFEPSAMDIRISPWTIFESSSLSHPYGFTYITHDLHSDDMRDSIAWLNEYIERNNGTLIITDFDEETNLLNARFPLSACVDGAILNDTILGYCQEIKRRFDSFR